MFHVFNASLKGRENNIKDVLYLWNPKNIYWCKQKRCKLFARIMYAGAIR
jgi:hypothetical protein